MFVHLSKHICHLTNDQGQKNSEGWIGFMRTRSSFSKGTHGTLSFLFSNDLTLNIDTKGEMLCGQQSDQAIKTR